MGARHGLEQSSNRSLPHFGRVSLSNKGRAREGTLDVGKGRFVSSDIAARGGSAGAIR